MMNSYVANFRDVGSTINALSGDEMMREGMLFRGGKIEDIHSLVDISSPKSIVNLRKGKDPVYPDVTSIHSPAPDSVEVYNIVQGRNKKWIAETLSMILSAKEPFPCYIHCAAGKDRTGVIVAAILSILEIDQELIREEYLLSTGLLQPRLISQTLEDLSDKRIYRKLDTQRLRLALVKAL